MLSGMSRNTKAITLTRMITSTGFSATIPFLALYLAVDRSAPLYLVGLMYLIQGATSLVSQVVAGLISDRFGPKRTLLLGYLFGVVSSVYMAALIYLDAEPLLIVLTYPVFSLFRGLAMPAQAALLAEEKSDAITNFSILAMASNLGFALGPAVGGILVAFTGYAFLFIFSALTSAATLMLTFLMREATYHLAAKKQSARPDRITAYFVVLCFLGYVVIGQDIQPFALFAGDTLHVSNLDIGYLFSFSGFLIVVLQLPVMRLLRRFGSHATIFISAAVAFASFIMLYLSKGMLLLLPSMAVITLAEILFVVPSQIWITRASPDTRKGAFQGYYSATSTAGRSVASWLGSTLQGLPWGAEDSWLVMAGLALCMLLGFMHHRALGLSSNAQRKITVN